MTVPIEASAMAGVDYNEWGLDIEKWGAEWPPPHRLAEEEDEGEPERVTKQGIQIIGASSLTNPWEDFDANSVHNAIIEAPGECEHRKASRGGPTLVEKIKQTSRSRKLMIRIRYLMTLLLIIARIVGRKRFLKPT